jgi:hypothetical protein
VAQFRQLNTDFWNNSYIASLEPTVRYFYLYLKLNGHVNTAGCCQLPIELMSVECGLPVPEIRKAVQQLEQDEKIKFQDDWVVLKEGNDGQTKSPKVRSAIDAQLAEAPSWVGEFVMKGSGEDDRFNHPAIVAVREILERYPKKELWDTFIEVLGEDFDIDLLIECQAEWARRGYSPFNYDWCFEWYTKGKVPYRTNGKRTNSDTLGDYLKEFSS